MLDRLNGLRRQFLDQQHVRPLQIAGVEPPKTTKSVRALAAPLPGCARGAVVLRMSILQGGVAPNVCSIRVSKSDRDRRPA
jgi:hypothetical protein